MSWSYSRALVAEFSEANCLDTEQSAQLNLTPTPDQFYSHGKTTEHSRLSRFGMTCEPLTESLGEELLTWFRAGFHVKPIPRQRLEGIQQTTFGRRCGESWQMLLPGTYLPKTLAELQLNKQRKTLRKWVTGAAIRSNFQRETWVQTMIGKDAGYLHTPTTQGNYCAPSMMKHRSCRNWLKVFGTVSPEAQEFLMGWPIGHTELKPLGTDKSRNVKQQHGNILEAHE